MDAIEYKKDVLNIIIIKKNTSATVVIISTKEGQ